MLGDVEATERVQQAERRIAQCNGHLPKVRMQRMNDIEPQDVDWLWPNRIPQGMLTMFVGMPGVGKSFVTLDIAARVSTGREWPDGRPSCGAGHVLLLGAEDDPSRTIRPRLDACGADANNISLVTGVVPPSDETDDHEPQERWLRFDRDMQAVGAAIVDTKATLLAVDPISAYLGDADSHKNAEVRAVLGPLATLAHETGCAIVCVNHFNKGSSGNAQMRSMGSMAFTAQARIGWAFGEHPNDKRKRLMLPMKSNIVEDPDGLWFQIVDGAVQWGAEPVDMTPDDFLREKKPPKSSAIEDAADFIAETLKDGPVESTVMYMMADKQGIKSRTLEAAKTELNVESTRQGRKWLWHLT
jgi:AAA domain